MLKHTPFGTVMAHQSDCRDWQVFLEMVTDVPLMSVGSIFMNGFGCKQSHVLLFTMATMGHVLLLLLVLNGVTVCCTWWCNVVLS